MDALLKILDSLKIILFLVFSQTLGVLGIFFILSMILHSLEKFTLNVYAKTVGWKGILWTAWLGTPVHEAGHALFALVFFHKIKSIKFFEPDQETGTLGYVDHSYNPKNLLHQIGRFFIGIGPLITGSFVIFAALYFLVPNSEAVFAPLIKGADDYIVEKMILDQLRVFALTAAHTLKAILVVENFLHYRFWIFIYIAFCVTSHMAPSFGDLKGGAVGFFTIFILLLLGNIIAQLMNFDLTSRILSINRYLGAFLALFALSIVISFINGVFSYLILGGYFRLRWGRWVSPF